MEKKHITITNENIDTDFSVSVEKRFEKMMLQKK